MALINISASADIVPLSLSLSVPLKYSTIFSVAVCTLSISFLRCDQLPLPFFISSSTSSIEFPNPIFLSIKSLVDLSTFDNIGNKLSIVPAKSKEPSLLYLSDLLNLSMLKPAFLTALSTFLVGFLIASTTFMNCSTLFAPVIPASPNIVIVVAISVLVVPRTSAICASLKSSYT